MRFLSCQYSKRMVYLHLQQRRGFCGCRKGIKHSATPQQLLHRSHMKACITDRPTEKLPFCQRASDNKPRNRRRTSILSRKMIVIMTDGHAWPSVLASILALKFLKDCILKNAKSIIKLCSLSVVFGTRSAGNAPPAVWKSVSDLAIIALKSAGFWNASGTTYLL